MRTKLGNIISVLFSLVKFSFMKIFHLKGFRFKLIERFSPSTTVVIGNGSKIILGSKVRMHTGSKISANAGGVLKIGDSCRINNNCRIACHDSITLESGVEFGPGVTVYDHDHDFRAEGGIKAGKYKTAPVFIGENSWICANAIILKGAHIGKNCVIGAGCIVTGDVPDNSVLVQKREQTIIPIEN